MLRRAGLRRHGVPSVALAAALVVVGGPALAGGLGPGNATLGAGRVAVASCGTLSTAVVTYVVTGKSVTGVVVSSLPAACIGMNLWVTLTVGTASAAQAGPIVIAAAATATTVSLSATPLASTVTNAYIAVSG
jgi:hypothetical protein